jgi:hypothetical protein
MRLTLREHEAVRAEATLQRIRPCTAVQDAVAAATGQSVGELLPTPWNGPVPACTRYSTKVAVRRS